MTKVFPQTLPSGQETPCHLFFFLDFYLYGSLTADIYFLLCVCCCCYTPLLQLKLGKMENNKKRYMYSKKERLKSLFEVGRF